jgi:hypothetical protein
MWGIFPFFGARKVYSLVTIGFPAARQHSYSVGFPLSRGHIVGKNILAGPLTSFREVLLSSQDRALMQMEGIIAQLYSRTTRYLSYKTGQ